MVKSNVAIVGLPVRFRACAKFSFWFFDVKPHTAAKWNYFLLRICNKIQDGEDQIVSRDFLIFKNTSQSEKSSVAGTRRSELKIIS